MHYCCRALFRTAEGHITRLLALSMEVSVATWGRRARRRGGLSDVSLQACVFWQTFSWYPKKPRPISKPASQPQVEDVGSAATGASAVWGTISEAEICLKRTNCRLWAGQGWGTVDTLKIAHALDKFRGPTQVTSVFRLHHFCFVWKTEIQKQKERIKKEKKNHKKPLYHVRAYYKALSAPEMQKCITHFKDKL